MLTKAAAQQNLALLNIITVLNGFRAYEGVLLVYFAIVADSYAAGMIIFAVMNISASIFEVPTGLLSDRIGRKYTLLAFYASGTLAILCFYLAEGIGMLVVGAIFQGLSIALRSGTLSAYVYENTEVLGVTALFQKLEGRRRALGRYSLVTAGVLGSWIIYVANIESAILVSLLVLTSALFLSCFLSDTEIKNNQNNIYQDLKTAWQQFKHDPGLRDISLGRMLHWGVGNSEYRLRSLFFILIMPEWLVNLLAVFNQLLSGIAMHVSHFFTKRFGFMTTIVHFDVLDRIISTVGALLGNISGAFLMHTTTSINFGLRTVGGEELSQQRFSQEQRATMGSLVGLGQTIVYSIAAIMIGLLADQIGPLNTILVLQPLLLVPTFFFYRGLKRIQSH